MGSASNGESEHCSLLDGHQRADVTITTSTLWGNRGVYLAFTLRHLLAIREAWLKRNWEPQASILIARMSDFSEPLSEGLM